MFVKDTGESYLPNQEILYRCSKCGVYMESIKKYDWDGISYKSRYYYDDKRYLEVIMKELIS